MNILSHEGTSKRGGWHEYQGWIWDKQWQVVVRMQLQLRQHIYCVKVTFLFLQCSACLIRCLATSHLSIQHWSWHQDNHALSTSTLRDISKHCRDIACFHTTWYQSDHLCIEKEPLIHFYWHHLQTLLSGKHLLSVIQCFLRLQEVGMAPVQTGQKYSLCGDAKNCSDWFS